MSLAKVHMQYACNVVNRNFHTFILTTHTDLVMNYDYSKLNLHRVSSGLRVGLNLCSTAAEFRTRLQLRAGVTLPCVLADAPVTVQSHKAFTGMHAFPARSEPSCPPVRKPGLKTEGTAKSCHFGKRLPNDKPKTFDVSNATQV